MGQVARRGQGGLLAAIAAVLVSAADTYVVVLVLPAMMTTFGISLTQLQRATPIVSGYLLGYIAVLPLIGRLSDRLGRRPLFFFAFLTFLVGSVVTASSTTLALGVVGRAVQGLGGGAILPLTFALAADRFGAEARSLPIGAVGATQELGSLLGPVYGAVIVTFSNWQTVFWLNCPLIGLAFASMAIGRPLRASKLAWATSGAALAAAVALVLWPPASSPSLLSLAAFGALVVLGAVVICSSAQHGQAKAAECLGWAGAACLVLQGISPRSLAASPSLARLLLPWPVGLSPLECAAGLLVIGGIGLALLGTGKQSARRALAIARRIDYPGVALAAGILATIVVVFATSDPSRAALPQGFAWVALAIGVALGAFVLVERKARDPLVPFGAFSSSNAWGGLLASFCLGVALIVVLVDVPLFARATTEPSSQLGAALILVRFLAGVPVGALAGGALGRRLGFRWPAAAGAALAGAMLAVMSTWGQRGLSSRLFGLSFAHTSDPVLVTCGLGMGATIAPLTTSLLNSTPQRLHGLGASLIVVARMVGMVVGVSLLTTVGLHAFATRAAALPSAVKLCPSTPLSCPRYEALFTGALTSELTVMFLSAALACAVSVVVVLATQRGTRRVHVLG